MSKINLSKIETPKHSKSMSLLPPPEINTLLIKQIGDYTIGEEIGSGAFGKVVLGKHILTGEKVAIKILDKMILNETPEDYELVRQEISILKLVKHKFIVQLYEIMQTAQHIFIIMEYCEGKEILDYILTKNKLSELESLKYFQQLINCLFYLHSQNITHRDIKIDNMLLDKNNDLKLIDFGLSTKYTDDNLLDQPCGTVVYAAPEVLEGKEYHGMLADVWSSGIVLFGMLAGFLPFSDKSDEVNKQQVIKGEIKIPDFFSDMAKDLLKHMLDIDPMTRYTLQEIKDHPWFNLTEYILIPGIIIDYNIIPVDEKILNLCVTYNKDKNEVFNSVRNNKHDSNSALYYLIIKKLKRKGFKSISDLCSDEFIDYILDENNLVHQEQQEVNENNLIHQEQAVNENTNYRTNFEEENEENKEEEILIENMIISNLEEEKKRENENKNDEDRLDKNNFKTDILEDIKDKDLLNDKKDNENNNLRTEPIKLIDILNESYSQKSKLEEMDENIKNNINFNTNLNEDNPDNNHLKNVDDRNEIIDKNIITPNNSKNKVCNDNILILPEKIEEKDEKDENKIIKEKEEDEKQSNEIISEEKNTFKDINKKILFEEILNENNNNQKEVADLGIQNSKKDYNDNINNKVNDEENIVKKENEENIAKIENEKNIVKIENININIINISENNRQNNNINENRRDFENQENIIKNHENDIKSLEKPKEHQKIINAEIDLTSINEIKGDQQIHILNNNDFNNLNIENELQNNDININDIEVIDIKINKNEKHISLKNENKRNKKTNEKVDKYKIFQNKKTNNNNYNKNNQLIKNTKKKIFSIEKSNNVLNYLKKVQIKSKQINKGKILLATDIKNNKNRSVFKMAFKQNNGFKRQKSKENEKIKKDSLKNINYSTRNTKKRLLFTKSKPEIESSKKDTNKKNHSNLKKNSNKLFSIFNAIDKNNFTSTATNFKIKSFIHSSSQNYKSTKKINKTNLQSKFDELTNEKNKSKNKNKKNEIEYNNIRLSLNIKDSNSKCQKPVSTTNKSTKKNNNSKKKYINNNYTSLLTQNKKEFNNINTINNNILKSIINLDYENKNGKNIICILKDNKISQDNQKIYNNSLSNTLDKKNEKIKDQIINRNEDKSKKNKKKSKHLESSVIINRYKSPIAIRELSESPKQKYLNIKTRYTRMPWKIKKKAIDEKIEPNYAYNKYINTLINPFNQNNSKIVNYKKYKNFINNNSIRNSNNCNKKKLNKTLWTTNIKQIKIAKNYIKTINKKKNKVNSSINKKKLSKERLSTNLLQNKCQNNKIINNNINTNYVYNSPNKNRKNSANSFGNSNLKFTNNINSLSSMNFYFNDNNNINNNTEYKNKSIFNSIKKNTENHKKIDKKYFSNESKFHHKHSNSVSSTLSLNLKNKFNDNSNILFHPIDLSCLFFKYKNLNEFCNYLKNKLKKSSISFYLYKSNVIICNKNGYNCEMEIVKINNNKNFYLKSQSNNISGNSENIFYLKIYNKKEGYKINDIFKKFILSLE